MRQNCEISPPPSNYVTHPLCRADIRNNATGTTPWHCVPCLHSHPTNQRGQRSMAVCNETWPRISSPHHLIHLLRLTSEYAVIDRFMTCGCVVGRCADSRAMKYVTYSLTLLQLCLTRVRDKQRRPVLTASPETTSTAHAPCADDMHPGCWNV